MSWSAPLAMWLSNLGVHAMDAATAAFLLPAFALALAGTLLSWLIERRSTRKE